MSRAPALGAFIIFALLTVYGAHLVVASPEALLRIHGLAFALFGAAGAIIGAAVALDRS